MYREPMSSCTPLPLLHPLYTYDCDYLDECLTVLTLNFGYSNGTFFRKPVHYGNLYLSGKVAFPQSSSLPPKGNRLNLGTYLSVSSYGKLPGDFGYVGSFGYHVIMECKWAWANGVNGYLSAVQAVPP